ncbi:MAG: acetyl-CoA carboxylase biotin carboxyl carrier protein subunit [Chitinophagales bacterium]|nr:acetyl-CoA carboxylase biotin carboxyl carrier protein subunit [Chitinophagales bacterium]
MYKVKVNDKPEMKIEITERGISLNEKIIDWNQIEIGKNRFHVLMNNQSFVCEVLSANTQKKSFEIKVNGQVSSVELKDKFDELLHTLGMDKLGSHKVNVIKAPMPGLVLKLLVKAEQELKEGDAVLILEAMKMENVIKSPGNGKVKAIKIKERDTVEKNQVLIELR